MSTSTPTTTYSCPQVNGVFDPMLCAVCERLGKKCYGPQAIDMPAKQLLEFCRRRRKFLDWTVNKVADEAKVARGTVSRLFAGEIDDFKHETIRPIYHALTGININSFVRPDDGPTVEELRAEIDTLKAQLEKAYFQRDEIAQRVREESRAHIEDLRRYNKNKVKALVIVSSLLFVSLAFIIGILVL